MSYRKMQMQIISELLNIQLNTHISIDPITNTYNRKNCFKLWGCIEDVMKASEYLYDQHIATRLAVETFITSSFAIMQMKNLERSHWQCNEHKIEE